MSKLGYDQFTQRLADTFAGLEPANTAAPKWQLTQQQIFRGGDVDAQSSEDEDDTQEQLDLPDGLLQMDTPGDEEFQQRPATGAFCRALDRESEYDDVDHVATGRDEADERPAGSTQVLPDNAYERRRSDPEADAAEPSGAENMDFGQSGEPPIRQSSPPAQRGPSSGSGSNGRKRVRFTAYVPPQRRSTDGSEPAQSGGGLKSSLKQRPGRPASRTGRQSTSTVPEHMQHPERFTVYELEEPLIVGGGDRSANPAPERSQVTIEEIEPSSMLEGERELPSFGSGIEFRPQRRSTASSSQQPGENAAGDQSRPAAAAAPGLSFLQDDPMDEDAGGAANTQLGGGGGSSNGAMSKAPRQRNYRNRS